MVLAFSDWFLTGGHHLVSDHPRARRIVKIVFTLLGVFVFLTVTMGIGLVTAHLRGVPAVAATEAHKPCLTGTGLMHMLTASMKGMVALTGLEAMSNGIQFVIDEDAAW